MMFIAFATEECLWRRLHPGSRGTALGGAAALGHLWAAGQLLQTLVIPGIRGL